MLTDQQPTQHNFQLKMDFETSARHTQNFLFCFFFSRKMNTQSTTLRNQGNKWHIEVHLKNLNWKYCTERAEAMSQKLRRKWVSIVVKVYRLWEKSLTVRFWGDENQRMNIKQATWLAQAQDYEVLQAFEETIYLTGNM